MRDSSEVKDLAHIRKNNQNKFAIAHWNIISLGNKFELLFYSMPFFSHNLASAHWFGYAIAEKSIAK